jgi:thymidylate synthase ThyX
MSKQITAEIIADSLSPDGCRITTFILELPRIILSELNTHRVFSKSSASSRAIPFDKMIRLVQDNPFIPMAFQKEHKGMQGNEYYEGDQHMTCVEDWLDARNAAIAIARSSFRYSITKQLRNRILEPFMMQRVILTGTDFENFFRLRAHGDAEIHFENLANKMLAAYNESQPNKLKVGEWHIPMGDRFESTRIEESIKICKDSLKKVGVMLDDTTNAKLAIATARCARTSYNNFEGNDDYVADIKMTERLIATVPRHLSPAEHIAQCTSNGDYIGNFKGFKQYRKFFVDENLSDVRVNSHMKMC